MGVTIINFEGIAFFNIKIFVEILFFIDFKTKQKKNDYTNRFLDAYWDITFFKNAPNFIILFLLEKTYDHGDPVVKKF